MIIAIFSRGMVTNLTTTAYTPRPPDLYPNLAASIADSGIAGNSVLGALGGEEMVLAATAAPAIAPPAARLPGRWTPRDAMCVVDDYCREAEEREPALRHRGGGRRNHRSSLGHAENWDLGQIPRGDAELRARGWGRPGGSSRAE